MATHHKADRRTAEPLRRLRRIARRDVREVCRARGVVLTESDEARLVRHLVGLSNPFFLRGRDAVLPAHRSDLRRRWIDLVLDGEIRTSLDVRVYGKRLAPCPSQDDETTRMRIDGEPAVTYNEALAAWRRLHRRASRPRRRTTQPC